jgi:mannose-6-phosphate isomerase-like protein (cupin superfamily)
MARITDFKGYASTEEPPIPRPAEPVRPNIVRVQDGVPVRYPGCDGIGVRVVHPVNPAAPAKNLGLVMFYVPPHVVLEPGSHWTEECYVILRGKGTMALAGEKVEVSAGTFIHLPPWCEHGIENTGDETLEILICTSPPNP